MRRRDYNRNGVTNWPPPILNVSGLIQDLVPSLVTVCSLSIQRPWWSSHSQYFNFYSYSPRGGHHLRHVHAVNSTQYNMQFGSSNRVDYDWHMKDEKVDVVDSYKYLGTWLHCKNNLQFSVKKVAESGANAIKGLIKRIIDNDITDIPVLLQLFQSLILPILTYNAEIWGMQKLDCLNKLCLKFYKQYILRLPYNASNAAVYGELGLTELKPLIAKKIAKYWIRLHSTDCPPLLADALAIQTLSGNYKDSWMHDWKQMLATSELYINTSTDLPEIIFRRLSDIATQNWHCDLKNNKKLRQYQLFKSTLKIEPYLTCIRDVHDRINLCKLRVSCHNLQIEKGRHYHPPIPVDQRICSLCKSNTTSTVEDEKHFLLHCPIYQSAHKSLFDFIKTIHRHFLYLSSDDKFHWIMTTENPQILIKLAKYESKCLSLCHRFVLAY